MRRASFAEAVMGDGAAALNTVFKDYLIPVTFSSEQLHLHMSYNDVEPALSPLWLDDAGKVIAAALLAVRGKRGWIGGFGVAPEYRGQGYATALVEHMLEVGRQRGMESITLEVLSENAPAIRVYRKAGFDITRQLFSFETIGDSAATPAAFVHTIPDELLDEPDRAKPCWQRERASLRNGAASTAVTDGNGTYALFRFNAKLAQVLKFDAQSTEKLSALASALASGSQSQRILVLNEPEESPLVAYAQEAGWTERFLQHEMQLHIRDR
jgi:ribosomal protein S18 acetylase RimI-like enzyme